MKIIKLTFAILLFGCFCGFAQKPDRLSLDRVMRVSSNLRAQYTGIPAELASAQMLKRAADFYPSKHKSRADTYSVALFTWGEHGVPQEILVLRYSRNKCVSREVHKSFVAHTFPLGEYYFNDWSPTTIDEQKWVGNGWHTISSREIRFNANGQPGRVLTLVADEQGIFFPAGMTEYQYDEHGSYLGIAEYEVINNEYALREGFRYVYTYNGSGQIVSAEYQEYNVEENSWEGYDLEEYTYGGDGKIKTVVYSFAEIPGVAFIKSDSFKVNWHRFDGKPGFYDAEGFFYVGGDGHASYKAYTLDETDGEWLLSYRNSRDYDQNGRLLEELEQAYGGGNNWTDDFRINVSYFNEALQEIGYFLKQPSCWQEFYTCEFRSRYSEDGKLPLQIRSTTMNNGEVSADNRRKLEYASSVQIQPLSDNKVRPEDLNAALIRNRSAKVAIAK